MPTFREGIVTRTALVEQRAGARATPVVMLIAGAGYGKSTLLAQWAAADERPFAWVSVTAQHRDPGVMLAGIADALDAVRGRDAGRARPGPAAAG